MAINTSFNKNTGIRYVYETTIVEDPSTGEKKRKRRVIGKIDEDTGQTIPTGSVGRPRKSDHLTVSPRGTTEEQYQLLYETEASKRKESENREAILREHLRSSASALMKAQQQVDRDVKMLQNLGQLITSIQDDITHALA